MRGSAEKRVVHEEAGFTLPEMLVTMMIMILVLFALYSIFDMSLRVFSFGNDKVEATANARLGMEKMEREIRAAYPVDRINGRQHVFFAPDSLDPSTSDPALPAQQSITFGNDMPPSGGSSDRKIDVDEAITYELRSSDGSACPTTGTEGVCTVFRREGVDATFQPVVESVVPNGLTFEYSRSNLAAATATDGTDIGIVRITLEVSVDGVGQTLTTDVDLRNRGG
jgi:prepilin-type N-terminal cleavage/methylation domain-containing protein